MTTSLTVYCTCIRGVRPEIVRSKAKPCEWYHFEICSSENDINTQGTLYKCNVLNEEQNVDKVFVTVLKRVYPRQCMVIIKVNC
jgi:hypothetical protein